MMAEFTSEIIEQVAAACQVGAGEAAEAIGRTFGGEFELTVGEAGTVSAGELPEELDGPGLALVLKVEDVAAIAVIAESTGLLPDWYADPDPTGVSKLMTLGQELGMLLLPEEYMALDFKAQRVENIKTAVQRGAIAESAGYVPISLTAESGSGLLHLIWPSSSPDEILADPVADEAKEETPAAAPAPAAPAPAAPAPMPAPTPTPAAATPGAAAGSGTGYESVEEGIEILPMYSRSLLKIRVPVIVKLASTKQSINQIVEMAPGSIIQFDKSCEETLTLEVGSREVAVGEAVKIGEKFGLRITSMIMPDERFETLRGVLAAAGGS